ncbi:hypothetical protein EEB14_20850 [Rhodococcus sp. WS4]|nr:hypothetical protein EEB14_20850 [Rhodococcus sp. WS4]
MHASSSAKNPAHYTMTILTTTDGQRAQMPEKFAAKLDQEAINSMVMQAHRGSALDRATCAAIACTPVAAE